MLVGRDRELARLKGLVSPPYSGMNEASEEVRKTIWHSLAIVERARKPKPVARAAEPESGNWVRQLSRLTTSFLGKREA